MKQAALFLLVASCIEGCAHPERVPMATIPARVGAGVVALAAKASPAAAIRPRPVTVNSLSAPTGIQPAANANSRLPLTAQASGAGPITLPTTSPRISFSAAAPSEKRPLTAMNKTDAPAATGPSEVPRSVAATKVEHDQVLESASGKSPTSPGVSLSSSSEFWYGVGTISGALFTSILAPLLVEVIKRRLETGRRARARFVEPGDS
jgi:hypothetical protein